MFLVRQRHERMNQRSLEVTRTYLQRGQAVTRSVWVRVSLKHPLLKLVMVPPMAILVLTMLVLILITLGFTLLAVALMGAIWRVGQKESEED